MTLTDEITDDDVRRGEINGDLGLAMFAVLKKAGKQHRLAPQDLHAAICILSVAVLVRMSEPDREIFLGTMPSALRDGLAIALKIRDSRAACERFGEFHLAPPLSDAMHAFAVKQGAIEANDERQPELGHNEQIASIGKENL